MANVVKKHSISTELAQKMLAKAVAKARELGVSENVAILDDGGNLKAFSRMDGAPILSIEIAQNKRIQRCSVSPHRSFLTSFKATRRSWLASHARACAAWEEGFRSMWTEKLSGDRAERAPTVTERHRLRESSLALVSDAVLVD